MVKSASFGEFKFGESRSGEVAAWASQKSCSLSSVSGPMSLVMWFAGSQLAEWVST